MDNRGRFYNLQNLENFFEEIKERVDNISTVAQLKEIIGDEYTEGTYHWLIYKLLYIETQKQASVGKLGFMTDRLKMYDKKLLEMFTLMDQIKIINGSDDHIQVNESYVFIEFKKSLCTMIGTTFIGCK